MASESIRERIGQHVDTTLAAITGVGDYHCRLEFIARSSGLPGNLIDLPAVHVTEGTETVSDGPLPFLTRMLALTLRGWIRKDDDDGLPLATWRNRLLQDLERALIADHTRGGLAINTRVAGTRILDDPDVDVVGAVELDLEILYRTKIGDPATSLP
jgi:hypothetical protein